MCIGCSEFEDHEHSIVIRLYIFQPFDELIEEVLAADGKTCDYYMNEILSKDQKQPQEPQEQQPEDSKETKEAMATQRQPIQRQSNIM